MSYAYKFFPEMSKSFNSYWNTYGEYPLRLYMTISTDETGMISINNNNIFELIFNNSFTPDNTSATDLTSAGIFYKFSEFTKTSLVPSVYRRLSTSPKNIIVYTSDSTGIDYFGLDSSSTYDMEMSNKLLNYRLGNSVDLSGIDYNELNTTYSKLIYSYLDLKLNVNYDTMDNIDHISDTTSPTSILQNMMEIYVLNEYHREIKNWEIYDSTSDYINDTT